MFLDAAKYLFLIKRVKYLSLILTIDRLEIDLKKVTTILKQQTPRIVKNVQAFLGFANFYRYFIKRFSLIVRPLIKLTKVDSKKAFSLVPNSKAVKAFRLIKKAFKNASMLTHFNTNYKTQLETDASNFVTAAVLLQIEPNSVLYSITFLFYKINPAECNYEIYNKKLLVIVRAFKEQRFELASTINLVKVLIDYQAL